MEKKIRRILSEHILDPEEVDELQTDTLLISGGYLDSISTLRFVTFLEEEFNIVFMPHEVTRDNLDSLELIQSFLVRKMENE
ncbi:hypothetical protein N9J52_01615 [Flavobacteriales bacterium]|nr:hypothetical protein [Flavobacteriales bacterium]